jgi:RNA-binding protein
MKSAHRAQLRKIANSIEPILHIGKQGVTESVVAQADEALNAREIIKGTVQQNADITAKEALEQLCAMLKAEPVQAIGRKFVLYRESKENKKIIFE